ncbi:hypothetical protein L2E82_11117 [Cichorium intybus]|uniref:Uncharacterized protein n=1 Tax=Cichorium intybus TaxID=13427 RepID=A0ACB9GD21_CICIN|nr:hypothetical protein L2E82_11117 [Cichorium intybus]
MYHADNEILPTTPSVQLSPEISTSNDDQPLVGDSADPQQLHGHNHESLSNFRSLHNSQDATHPTQISGTVTIAVQQPSCVALAGDHGNSHNQIETINDSSRQPPSHGSILCSNQNSETTADNGYKGNHLLTSGNDAGVPKASESKRSALDQNVCNEEYSQMSLTGKNIGKYKPPPYYLDGDSDYH